MHQCQRRELCGVMLTSSIATGVVLEIDDIEVGDAAWLRKKGYFGHISVAELDAVLKAVSLGSEVGLEGG